jgi:DNA-binding PadR family transcriptional regulator
MEVNNMEIIILGLLIIQKNTIYELRKIIKTKFGSMCSSSTGSIQASIKKLLKNGMVIFTEHVENSINKKVYNITEKGKKYFLENVSKPMLNKEKNMELAKFFFMGFVTPDKRIDLIDSYISQLKTDKEYFYQILSSEPDKETAVASYMNYLKINGITKNFEKMLSSNSVLCSVQDIAIFQYASLDLAIAKIDFEIRWFTDFRKKITKT